MRTPDSLSVAHYGIVLVGVGVRLAFALANRDLDLYADEATYVYLAAAWNRFGIYLGSQHWLWPPGYPAFLAVFLDAFRDGGVPAAKIAQSLLSSSIGLGVVWLATRTYSARAGLVAGVLWAAYLPLIGFTHYLWPETLFLCLVVPAVALYAAILGGGEEGPGTRMRLVGAGLLLGVACLVKESGLPVALALAVGLLLVPASLPPGRRLIRAAILLAAFLLPVLPWTIRNYDVYARWIVGGNTLGQNLWIGMNARYRHFDYSDLRFQDVYSESDWVYRTFIDVPDGERPWGRSTAPNIVDRTAENVTSAKAFARRNPGYFVRSRVKKAADWVAPLSFFDRHVRLGLYDSGWMSAPVQRSLVGVSVVLTMVVLVGAVPGLLLAIRTWPERLPFALPLAAIAAPFWIVSMSRYRLPAEPFLIVLAAGFLARTGAPWRGRREVPFVLAGWTILLLLWLLNFREVRHVLGGLS